MKINSDLEMIIKLMILKNYKRNKCFQIPQNKIKHLVL